jgi:hypothetical protein
MLWRHGWISKANFLRRENEAKGQYYKTFFGRILS